jgi:hypothetical protein
MYKISGRNDEDDAKLPCEAKLVELVKDAIQNNV